MYANNKKVQKQVPIHVLHKCAKYQESRGNNKIVAAIHL